MNWVALSSIGQLCSASYLSLLSTTMFPSQVPYELTEEDTHDSDYDPPCGRAARNPNPNLLLAILAEWSRRDAETPPSYQRCSILRPFSPHTHLPGSIYGTYSSPLAEAIKASLPANIEILLKVGVDPNGILLGDLDEFSVRFLRGRNPKYNNYNYVSCPEQVKAMAENGVIEPQISALTDGEIIARRRTFSRFWTEPRLPTFSFRSNPARTSLEIAASVGNIPVFDQVRAANPNEIWWTAKAIMTQLPETLTHSTLSALSPVHEAIISGKDDMLKHLLSIGYSPNILPLAAPTCCLPPHASAIAFCNPPNLKAYDILTRDTRTDTSIRTPIYLVHVLHFAVAHLDIPLLKKLSEITPLTEAGSTALGHTLLHIASLPLMDRHVSLFSKKIFESIHDVRTLDTKSWFALNLHRRNPANRGILYSCLDNLPLPRPFTAEDKIDQEKQEEMILWLLDLGHADDLATKDVYGNTPLHYLASFKYVNEGLVEKLKASDGGQVIWEESRNEMGHSPCDLYEDRANIKVEQWKDFWM